MCASVHAHIHGWCVRDQNMYPHNRCTFISNCLINLAAIPKHVQVPLLYRRVALPNGKLLRDIGTPIVVCLDACACDFDQSGRMM